MESKEDAAVERQKLVPDDGENEPDDEQPPLNNIISPIVPKTVTQTPISPVLSHKIFSSGDTSRTQDSSNCSVGRGGNSESGGPHSARLIYINERKPDASKLQPDYKAKARRVQREPDDGTATTIVTTSDQHHLPPQATHETATPHNPHPPITLSPTTNVAHLKSTTATLQPTTTSVPPPPHSLSPSSTNVRLTPSHSVANDSKVTFDDRPLKHHSFITEDPDVRHMERALLGLLEDFHLGKLKAFGSGCTMEQMTDIREQQESLAKLHFELGAGGDPQNSNSSLNAQENMSQLVAKLENLSVSIERLNSSNTNL